jgi:hypothetical protein
VGFSSTLIIGSAILLPITLINQHHAANQKSLIDELIQHDYSNENISENADNLSSLLDDNDKINEIVSDYTLSNQEKNDKILEIACLNGINLIDSTTIDHELEFLRNNALTQLTNTNLNNEQISACNAIINEKINLFEDKIGNEILTIEQLDQYTDSLIDQEISLHDQDNELTKEVINLQNAKDFLELITNDNLSILENCY